MIKTILFNPHTQAKIELILSAPRLYINNAVLANTEDTKALVSGMHNGLRAKVSTLDDVVFVQTFGV